jgi:hypothetical protein
MNQMGSNLLAEATNRSRTPGFMCSIVKLWRGLTAHSGVGHKSLADDHGVGDGRLPFNVTALNVTVEEGVKLDWQGREIDSGRLSITLGAPGSAGVIDYDTGKVDVEFRVQIAFDELSELLNDIGADPGFSEPVAAVIKSEGSVFGDHSLRLSGRATLAEHRLFDPAETRISIRAPSQ